MGKKRIASKNSSKLDANKRSRSLARTTKKRHSKGVLNIAATYNTTKVMLADTTGKALAWSSSGALGFKGAKKGTPFAASKVGDLVAEKAVTIGIKDVDIVIKGVGAGREGAMRSFATRGIGISSIKDMTPVAWNGPRAPKVRRV